MKSRGFHTMKGTWISGLAVEGKGGAYIIPNPEDDLNQWKFVPVRKETLGAFTGYCDSTSKELFQGDVPDVTIKHGI